MKDEFHPTIASSITPNIQFPPQKNKSMICWTRKEFIISKKNKVSYFLFISTCSFGQKTCNIFVIIKSLEKSCFSIIFFYFEMFVGFIEKYFANLKWMIVSTVDAFYYKIFVDELEENYIYLESRMEDSSISFNFPHILWRHYFTDIFNHQL